MTSSMTRRDYFAAHAPITRADVVSAFGFEPNLANDQERTAFLAVWALLATEYADALVRQLGDDGVYAD